MELTLNLLCGERRLKKETFGDADRLAAEVGIYGGGKRLGIPVYIACLVNKNNDAVYTSKQYANAKNKHYTPCDGKMQVPF